MWKTSAIFAISLCLPLPSLGWGPKAHRAAADVARAHLSPAALRQIRELLGTDDLAGISTWADEIRNSRPETYAWHFVDIPWDANGFSQPRDCFHPDARRPSSQEDHHNCVVDRIEIFAGALRDRSLAQADRIEALKFLVHFVADLHLPLHAISRARGGNDVSVSWFGSSSCGSRTCNLHYIWDVELFEHSHLSESELAMRLERLATAQGLRADGTPQDWANESFALAHQVWLDNGALADESYYEHNVGVAEARLALSGLRLAVLLNAVLGNGPSTFIRPN